MTAPRPRCIVSLARSFLVPGFHLASTKSHSRYNMSVTRYQPTLTTKPHTNSRYTHASTPPQRHLMFLAFLALHHAPNPPPTHM
ncbi:hypothetical protein PIB30_091995, partial [Stylosanthes scabra]|nr:hypothetical protein [Stylosanthes scabra]